MSKTAFEAPRGSFFYLLPEEVVIVGLDTDDGSEHPLYSPTVHDSVPQELVDSIEDLGVLEPIAVVDFENDRRAFCRLGRKRTLAARQVNVARAARGEEPLRIPAINATKGTTHEDLTLQILAENNIRFADTPMTKATIAAAHFKRFGDSAPVRKRLAKALGTRVQELDGLLKVRESGELADAVTNKEIGVQAAVQIATLPRPEQLKIVETVKQGGKITADEAREKATKHRRAKKAAKAGVATDDIVLRPSLRTIRNVLREVGAISDEKIPAEAYHALRWVLGEGAPSKVRGLSAILNKLERADKKDAA